ncbi:hypothetical protein BDF22DRAFT_739037 [Syncephalis plumigaleata]|nr:hypothetical protein BDF22DRAFT_739037 [Syncephalis plumigaleata]
MDVVDERVLKLRDKAHGVGKTFRAWHTVHHMLMAASCGRIIFTGSRPQETIWYYDAYLAYGMPTMQPSAEKPSVLIVGALDTHVANVVHYLVDSGETSAIRVATYKSLTTCCFTPACMEAFSHVECVHANINNAASLESVFARDDGKPWDFIFFFPEQRTGQSDQVYKLRTVEGARAIAARAATSNAKVLVYMSSGLFYKKNSNRNSEDAPINPQVLLHRAMVEMEQEFAKLDSVPTIGLRPAVLFGSQMYNSAMLPLAIARVYKELDQPAPMPNSSGSPHDFVHIQDVSRAFLHVAQWRARNPPTGNAKHVVFNLAPPSGTDITTLMSMESLQEDMNDLFVTEWTKLLARSKIEHTPISTYIEKEHLVNDQFALDGQRITKLTGFQYQYPQITVDDAREMLREAQSMRFWPQEDEF